MMRGTRAYLAWWWLVFYVLSFLGSRTLLAAAQQDDDDQEEVPGAEYDPLNEDPVNKCRRNPTWKEDNEAGIEVDYYETCRKLVGWEPRDIWWRLDPQPAEAWLGDGIEQQIWDCLNEAIRTVDEPKWWTSCNETNRSEACFVEEPVVISHYAHLEDGDIVMVRNALTEQEAHGLESLVQCMQKLLPNEMPFYEERKFGKPANDDGLYSGEGGNLVTFVQGMIQKYLPGVTSSMYRAVQEAYDQADWYSMDLPQPHEMGLRTAEYLQYKKTGRLGLHADSESILTISVALSNENDYEGGFFHLTSESVLFKAPRLSAVVFFSESDHGISPILGGDRKCFVVELWDEDDVPLGTPRPPPDHFHEYQAARIEALGLDVDDEGSDSEAVREPSTYGTTGDEF